MSFAPSPSGYRPSYRPSLAALLAASDALPVRLLCTGGVVWDAGVEGRWHPAMAGRGSGRVPGGGDGDPRPALGVTGLDRWLATHALRPLALATADAVHGERLTLMSAVGALGWRPPLDLLARVRAAPDALTSPAMGEHRALRRAELYLHALADATEQHAVDAVERYARAATAAARIAQLLDVPVLHTVGATPGLFVAVDALAAAALRTLAAVEALAEGVFGRGLLAAPPTLRSVLLHVRAAYAAPATAWRRRLLRHAVAGLGAPTVRVRRLAIVGSSVWAVRVPIDGPAGGPGGTSMDALEAAWELATEVWHAAALVVYAATGAWAFD